MMTREQIAEKYEVDANGIIRRSRGGFKGQPIYAAHFYENKARYGAFWREAFKGNRVASQLFMVFDDDRAEFPELGDANVVQLTYTDKGTYCQACKESKEALDRIDENL
jgi:hypothetical protein